jgi:hypothetical protein
LPKPPTFVLVLLVAGVTSTTATARAQEDDLVVPAEAPTKVPAHPAAGTPPQAEAAASQPSSPPPTAPPSSASTVPVSHDPAPSAEAAMRADVEALRGEVAALREKQDAPRPFLELWDSTRSSTTPWDLPGRDGLWVAGYMQSQYEAHQESQDQLAPGGAVVNKDRFVVRRTRLKLIGAWRFAETQIELNGDTTSGFNVNLQHAEATLHYRPDPAKVPLIAATLGLFDTPFGYELPESPRSRPFMERTTMSRAFWAGEPDLGVRLAGGLSFFRWTIAVLNGHPLGDKQYPGQDPVSAKDVVFRFGADTEPRPGLKVTGDFSVLTGRGFHAGTDATKASLQWNDLNEDGIVQPNELQGVPAQAATPSQTFSHWAIGADLQVATEDPLGALKVYGEVTVGQNIDRAFVIADPVQSGTDTRELGFYVGVTQEVMKYGLVGFRYDYYDPNADIFDKRGGQLIPFTDTVQTFSPLVGLILPHRARALVEYDVIRNYLARDPSGVPTNLKTNTLTARLQVEL